MPVTTSSIPTAAGSRSTSPSRPESRKAPAEPLLASLPQSLDGHVVRSERVVRALEAHAAAEADSMATFERLKQVETDPVAELLMQLVVDDEQRHHDLLARMIASLRDGPEQTEFANGLPAPTPLDPEQHQGAVVATRALIREEREGARYLRHLARQEPTLYGGMFALLLETMARDSEKHERILRFLLRRLEGTA